MQTTQLQNTEHRFRVRLAKPKLTKLSLKFPIAKFARIDPHRPEMTNQKNKIDKRQTLLPGLTTVSNKRIHTPDGHLQLKWKKRKRKYPGKQAFNTHHIHMQM
ncbi:conserved domain protein [Trichinella spiralis]|uniref:hypothetical protein n=1 Tax=Trichinella spiralis TaxID=6334 RepID=UPI0001EFC7AC|nr:conserved domain protein [Trichinella spiralis]